MIIPTADFVSVSVLQMPITGISIKGSIFSFPYILLKNADTNIVHIKTDFDPSSWSNNALVLYKDTYKDNTMYTFKEFSIYIN